MELDDFLEHQTNTSGAVSQDIGMVKREGFIPFKVTTDSFFFPMFQEAMKKAQPGNSSVIVTAINKVRSDKLKMEVKDQFRLDFQWQDEKLCGIDVFKNVGEIL